MGDSPARKARLRERAIAKEEELRRIGAKCGNCACFVRRDHPSGLRGSWCGLLTDFHGVVRVPEDDLCLKWRAKEEAMRR